MTQQDSPAARELRDTDRAARQSVTDRDLNAVREWLADNATNYGPFTPAAEGRDEFLASFEQAFGLPGFSANYPEPSRVHVSGDGSLGYTVALEEITVMGPDGAPVTALARYLAVWERQPDGRWRAIENMWNFAAPPPPIFVPPPVAQE